MNSDKFMETKSFFHFNTIIILKLFSYISAISATKLSFFESKVLIPFANIIYIKYIIFISYITVSYHYTNLYKALIGTRLLLV